LPYQLFIVVTNKCSARCKLCGYWKIPSEEEKFLSLPFIQDKIIPLILKKGIEAVCITGGEPTLHPGLSAVVEKIAKTGATVTLITNGSHLSRIFDKIKDNVTGWLFSLDASHSTLHTRIRGLDNFDEIIGWPEKIGKCNPSARVAFNCLLQESNIGDIVDLYELICHLPCEGIFFNVPELKPYCFGKHPFITKNFCGGPGGGFYKKRPLVNVPGKSQIKILAKNLETIVRLDTVEGRCKLMQGEQFFKKVITYFEYLQGDHVEFRDSTCSVPFNSFVVDENQRVLPCFYLPPDVGPIGEGDELIGENYLDGVRQLMSRREFRERYCGHCFQFQG
jgi:MoaA/NifB/PqqE/SkfB family radical SAM enzyme